MDFTTARIKPFQIVVFVLCVLTMFTYFNFWEILFWPPQGIHFMRQVDSLSFITYYMHTGNGLFEPGTFSLFSKDGRTASEFPLIYYLMSFVWQAFGRQEFLIKLIHLTATTFGLWHLFLLAKRLTNHTITALCVVVFGFSSSVWIYYANNFLPDASALGLTFSGIYFFIKYIHTNQHRASVFAMLLFMCAALMKISYFIYPIALVLYILWLDFRQPLKHKWILLQFVAVTCIVLAWVIFASYYNSVNHGYFLSRSKPIWSLDAETIKAVFKMITQYWSTWYYSPPQLIVFILVLFTGIYALKKNYRILLIPFIMLSGAISFVLLFFHQFHNHDYYMLTIFPMALVMLIFVLQFITRNAPFFVLLASFIIVGGSGVWGATFAKNYVFWRYWNARENEIDQFAYVGVRLKDARSVLDQYGIDKDAKFIYIKDPGVNGAPYYCNRFGWNIWDTTSHRLSNIPTYISEGADYILLTDSVFISHPVLSQYLAKPVIHHTTFWVFEPVKDSTKWPTINATH